MINDNESLKEEIKKLEELSRINPKEYNKKLVLFTILGYAYIAMLFILLSGCIALTIFISLKLKLNGGLGRIIFILIGLIILLLRSLFIRIPKPDGIYVERKDVPKIFEMIDDITKSTNASKIHRVLISDELNAGIIQRPRLGILGFNTSYLEIGIQLMMALSEDELRAVLAHEIGHISNNHGKFGNWIYRMNLMWYTIRENFENKNRKGIFLIKRFFDWYIPTYNIYSHVILRKQENDADKFAVKVAGNKVAASSILNIIIKSNYMDKIFWTSIEKEAVFKDKPVDNIYGRIMEKFREEMNDDFKIKSIRKELARLQDPFDTHPPLEQRLKEMGQEVFIPSNSNIMAITLLEEKMQEYIDILSKKWQKDIKEVWEEKHYSIQECKERLQEYKNQGGYYKLLKDDKLEFAYLHEIIKNDEEALKWYLEFIKEFQDCEDANFFIGRLYIQNDNMEGIKYIKKAISLGDTYASEGYRLIYNILIENDRIEEAKSLYKEATKHSEYLDNIYEEKENLYVDDEYIPHNLKPYETYDIVKQLEKNNRIKEAYLVSKKIKTSKRDEKFYILGVVLDFHWYTDEEKYVKAIEEILDNIEVDYEIRVLYLNLENARFKDIFEKVENSKVYIKNQ